MLPERRRRAATDAPQPRTRRAVTVRRVRAQPRRRAATARPRDPQPPAAWHALSWTQWPEGRVGAERKRACTQADGWGFGDGWGF